MLVSGTIESLLRNLLWEYGVRIIPGIHKMKHGVNTGWNDKCGRMLL